MQVGKHRDISSKTQQSENLSSHVSLAGADMKTSREGSVYNFVESFCLAVCYFNNLVGLAGKKVILPIAKSGAIMSDSSQG